MKENELNPAKEADKYTRLRRASLDLTGLSPDSEMIEVKKERFKQIGHELFDSGGVDAMENFFFAVDNRIQGEINLDPKPFRPLWNGITDEWNYS